MVRELTRGAACTIVLLVALVVTAPVAEAETLAADGGSVSVALDYAQVDFLPVVGSLRVTRNGALLVNEPVVSSECPEPCYLADPTDASTLRVVDLTGDGEPEIVVALYTGGAHCCLVARVLSYVPALNSYAIVDRLFGDSGFVLDDIGGNGVFEFKATDYRFGARFTAYAFSGMPIAIFTFNGVKFEDVTKSHKTLIKRDAKQWYRAWRGEIKGGKLRKDSDIRGLVAAWAADQFLLGNGTRTTRRLRTAARRGWLGGSSGRRGSAYVRDLLGFLRNQGYR